MKCREIKRETIMVIIQEKVREIFMELKDQSSGSSSCLRLLLASLQISKKKVMYAESASSVKRKPKSTVSNSKT